MPTGAALGILPHFQHTSAAPPGKKSSSKCAFPHNKWNPIEHRLFSEISRNWSGCPLESFDLILNYIASTTTRTGLVVTSRLNRNEYPAGIQISDEQMEALNITRNNEPIPKVELQHLSLSKLTSYFCAPPKESVATVRPSPNRLSRRYRGPSVSICPAGRKIFLGTAGRSKNRQPAWLRRSHAAQAPCSRLSHLTTIQPPDPG